jgi:ATP synthase protein I
MSDPSRQSGPKNMRALGALSAVGIAFVLAVVIGFLAGYGLDSWLGTSPLFTILFFFLGVGAGVLNVVRTASSVTRDEDE